MSDRQYSVYVLASKRNGTLYVGVTNDLVKRVWQHKNGFVPGFTQRYCVHRLVCFEMCSDVNDALKREKNMKSWKRAWKISTIESANLYWRELSNDIC